MDGLEILFGRKALRVVGMRTSWMAKVVALDV